MFQNNEIEDFKKTRERFIENIRKSNHQQTFSKHRNMDNIPFSQDINTIEHNSNSLLIVDNNYYDSILQLIQATYHEQMFDKLCSQIQDNNILVKHRGVIGIRKILSMDDYPPIQKIIDKHLIPLLIEFIQQYEYPQLQLQAAWILTNVASGNTIQCQSIVNKGVIPIFIKLLIQNKYGIVDQAVWAIGNIAGDCIQNRNSVLKVGGLRPLIQITQTSKNSKLVQKCAWTLSNLCRGSPLPTFELVKQSVPTLCKVIISGILSPGDLSDCLWAISYMSQGQKSRIQRVIQTGIIPKLLEVSQYQQPNVVIPALRILGNISTGNELQTEQLLKNGVIQIFNKLLDHQNKCIRRQICWILSNITAGTNSQVHQIINHNSLLIKIIHLFQVDEMDVKKQICYIFSNMAHLGQAQSILNLYLQYNIINYYAMMLNNYNDSKTIQILLDCLFHFLSVGEKLKSKFNNTNILITNLASIPNVLENFQKLQYHKNQKIYNRIIKILEKYFTINSENNMATIIQ